jgi:inner membrane protein
MMIAEGLCAARRSGRSAFRTAAYAASAVANNIPDIDPIYTSITQPPPLGSLLHHRGHTHTLPVAWLLGLLVSGVVLFFVERRRGALEARDRWIIAALGLLGATLHITMDFGNNYGVHPFWPVDAHWFYGDSIFIIEPLWLAVALPTLACAIFTRWFAWFLWALLAALFGLALRLPFVTTGTVIAMALASAVVLLVSKLGSERARIGTAWGLYLGVACCFVLGGSQARAAVGGALAAQQPSLHVVDIATTPMPGNPLCWNALVVGEDGASYRVLSANVSAAPGVVDAAACPYDSDAQPTARVERMQVRSRADVHWHWSYAASLGSLRELAASDCRFRALQVSPLGLSGVPG